MTLHEAAKRGDVTAVKTFLDKKKPLDSQDFSAKTDENDVQTKRDLPFAEHVMT